VHDAVSTARRRRSIRIRGTEQGDTGNSESGREVHGAGIVGHQDIEVGEDGGESGQVEVGPDQGVDLAALFVDSDSEPGLGGAGDEDLLGLGSSPAELSGQLGKALPRPTFGRAELGAREETDQQALGVDAGTTQAVAAGAANGV
jgi:hypothetical protein